MNTNDIQPILEEQQTGQRKKCHGNRSDQRFRRSCRKQNMSEAIIAQLIEQRRNSRRRNTVNQTNNDPTSIPMQHGSSTISDLTMQVSLFYIFIDIDFFLFSSYFLASTNHHYEYKYKYNSNNN